ncbi:MAG: biotin synthase BioB [Nitrosopumilus sp.]|nr:biotin synthase BioB [Nitrosopumilus sp.]MDH3385032.1 biotin synthase BioB [Nitrosopumilus sp.]
MSYSDFIKECQENVLSGVGISSDSAAKLFEIPKEYIKELANAANQITREFNGNKVDVEQLNNIKKNSCSEDCSFCGQSAFFDTGIESYQLPSPTEVVSRAQKAKDEGAKSYCLVAAWREPSPKDFSKVCTIIEEVNNKVGISVECSLGFLTYDQAKKLKELNVKRYNHNLETAKSKFAEICTTHTYEDRLRTLQIARDAGLELCTGGIIGLGETQEQRLELVLALAAIYPEEITINILVPVPGTPLELQTPLEKSEIIRMFSVIRFLLPESVIKISGGRETNLDDSGEELLQSGANGIITSGYLTLGGNDADQDIKMIKKIGLEV